MPDLLVRLYDLPDIERKLPAAVTVRPLWRPSGSRLSTGSAGLSATWAGECEVAFSAHPITTWIATRGNDLVGFACADATAKGFFGPTGVDEKERGQGIGEALLMAALRGMREAGYAYAVIGGAGPVAFYRKRLDVLEIPGSDPGVYKGMLQQT